MKPNSIWSDPGAGQLISAISAIAIGLLALLGTAIALSDPLRSIFAAICIVIIAGSLIGILLGLAHIRGWHRSWKFRVLNIVIALIGFSLAVTSIYPVIFPSDTQTSTIYADTMRGFHPDDGTWDQTQEDTLKANGAGDCTFATDGYHVLAVRYDLVNYRECKAKIVQMTGNFTIEAHVTILTPNTIAGFLLRRQVETETGYLIGVQTTGQCQILKDPGDNPLTSLCGIAGQTAKNSFLLDVTMSGKQITVEIDHKMAGSASDATYTDGILGLYVTRDASSPPKTEAVFTDIKISSI